MKNEAQPVFLWDVLFRYSVELLFYSEKLLIGFDDNRGDDKIGLVFSGPGFVEVGESHQGLTKPVIGKSRCATR
jgi:hypothetical protein